MKLRLLNGHMMICICERGHDHGQELRHAYANVVR